MTRYLYKCEAIHPRGQRYKSGVKRKGKFTESGKNTLAEKLDFIAAAIDDLLEDFEEGGESAKILFAIKQIHSLHTASLSTEARLRIMLRGVSLLKPAKAVLQRYYREGKLKPTINRSDLHKFLAVVDDVLGQAGTLKEIIEQIDSLKDKISGLGFDVTKEILR